MGMMPELRPGAGCWRKWGGPAGQSACAPVLVRAAGLCTACCCLASTSLASVEAGSWLLGVPLKPKQEDKTKPEP